MVRKMLKISGIIAVGFILYLIIDTLTSDGVKSVYCLSGDKCVTVWKRANGEKYIVFGRYESEAIPPDNYIKMSNLSTDYLDVLFLKKNKLLITIDDKTNVVVKSSNGLIELYRDNKIANDSLYTYFDGNYSHYNKEIDFIAINIQENYATDKNGKKLK